MPNLITAQFKLTGTATKRSFGDHLRDYNLSVKDFGAVGDGLTNDTAAIQAAFNYAFGTDSDPNNEANSFRNWVIHFPRGLYKINAPLNLRMVWSVTLIGAGSNQSRVFWDPASPAVQSAKIAGQYPVLEMLTCWHTHIEGLTFDASGVQSIVLHCGTYPTGPDDGSDGYYRDVHMKGAVKIAGAGGQGVSYSGIAMGSERTWVKCKFTNCVVGYGVYQGNTINHFFYGCVFKDNQYGLYQVGQGGSLIFVGCWGENNSLMDFRAYCSGTRVQGCHSTSVNFASTDGYVGGCTHDNASAGWFLANANISGEDTATSTKAVVIIGNHSTHGTIDCDGGPGNNISCQGTFLKGNKFDDVNYYANTLTRYYGSAVLWVDGTQINPPPVGIWNTLRKWTGSVGSSVGLSGGNLVATGQHPSGTVANVAIAATTPCTFGKKYFEITVTSLPSAQWGIGVCSPTDFISSTAAGDFAGNINDQGVTMSATGSNAAGNAVFNTGTVYTFDTDPTIANGDKIGVAVDGTARRVWFRYNGTWLKGDPVAGTNGCAMTGIAGSTAAVFPYVFMRPASATDGVLTLNLGATAFANAAPTGFTAWG